MLHLMFYNNMTETSKKMEDSSAGMCSAGGFRRAVVSVVPLEIKLLGY